MNKGLHAHISNAKFALLSLETPDAMLLVLTAADLST
jgi:hypothetical protein